MSLKHRIAAEIADSGPITVARFMERALYEPIMGYYSSGNPRAGSEWFTGPTLHPIFGWTLARGLAPLLAQLDPPRLIDVGTGGGHLARDVVFGLAKADPATFERLQISLVDRTDTILANAIETLAKAGIDLRDVSASSELPDAFSGVVVANELLDAVPAHLCESTEHGPVEMYVTMDDDKRFQLVQGRLSSPEVANLAGRIWKDVAPGKRYEVPAIGLEWYEAAAREMTRGAFVVIDYGDTLAALTKEYHRGTIHAYRDGLQVREFLANPGEQDITYRVPFDLFRAAGERGGLTTRVYATQGRVLQALGIDALLADLTPMDALAAKKLVDPVGAGGIFKVLVQTKGIDLGGPWPA